MLLSWAQLERTSLHHKPHTFFYSIFSACVLQLIACLVIGFWFPIFLCLSYFVVVVLWITEFLITQTIMIDRYLDQYCIL